MPGVSSVQITFHEDKAPEQHAMPPGGFRLAIVNAWNLQPGLAGRELLRTHFLARRRDDRGARAKRAQASACASRRSAERALRHDRVGLSAPLPASRRGCYKAPIQVREYP